MRKWPILLGFVIAGVTPVLAEPRDDALAAMYRCGAIAEMSARLSCYDTASTQLRGAAQTAPQAVPQPAPAYVSPAPLPAGAYIPPPQRRSGFDRFLGSVFGDDGPARPPQTSVQQFGSEGIPSHGEYALPGHRQGDTVDAIGSRLSAYQFTGNARLMVRLVIGQDWIQIPGGDPVGHLAHPPAYYRAEIRRGGSGTYLLYLSGIPKVIYVRRMR